MAKIKKRAWKNASGEHVAWQIDFTDRHGHRHREQFAIKRDAEDRLAELQGTTRDGTYRPLAQKFDVAAACAEFCTYMTDRSDRGEKVTETYLRTVRQHCENYIDPDGDYVKRKADAKRVDRIKFKGGIGSIKLADLTASRVVKFRDDMRKHGTGIVSVRRVLGTLSRVLKRAIETDMAVVNVAQGIRVTGTRDEDSERVVPPSKEALKLLLAAADDDFKLAIQFAAATGLRASEQWALKWRNIDLKKGVAKVDSRLDAFGTIDTTKSPAGKREVPIGKALLAALTSWHEKAAKIGPDDFVFPAAEGGFIRHTNMTKRQWNPLVLAAGIDDIGWHSLRHYAVSTWIEAGLQPKAVQTLAGHATFKITMDRYGHLFKGDDHQAAFDKIAETLA